MQLRTIKDLHNKDYGHRKFAKVVDTLSLTHKITDIKEYNEKFKFKVDDEPYEYQKDWKASAQTYINFIEMLIKQKEIFKSDK